MGGSGGDGKEKGPKTDIHPALGSKLYGVSTASVAAI